MSGLAIVAGEKKTMLDETRVVSRNTVSQMPLGSLYRRGICREEWLGYVAKTNWLSASPIYT